MHTRLLFLLVLLYCVQAKAQKKYTYKDTIYTNAGEIIIGRIIFMAEDSVYYNYYMPDSTITSSVIARNEVKRTGLSERRTEIINEEEKHINGLSWPLHEKYALKGSKDAEKYYDDYTSAGSGTLIIGLLSPLLGLIPAISCSSTMPKDKNLNYPNTKLMDNQDYRKGYTHRAKKMKQTRVWTNWSIAFGVNVILVVILSHSGGGQ